MSSPVKAPLFPLPKLVLCDLDGTLVDSIPDLAYALDAMMAQLEMPLLGSERARDWVGNGVERLVKRALTGEMQAEPDADLFERALPLFYTAYQACSGQNSVLYPNVATTLQWFKDRGCKLGCVTNKSERFTTPLLEHLSIMHFFEVVVSGDTLAQKKPDPAQLIYAAQQVQVPLTQTIFIGDSTNDVQAARAAPCPVICVSYGYNHGKDIRDTEPNAVVDDFGDIAALFSNNET